MRLCLFGSRNVSPSLDEIDATLALALSCFSDSYSISDRSRATSLICGMAQGADLAGHRWAAERGIKIERYPVERIPGMNKWAFTQAAYARNRRMAEACDIALGFWKGQSGGTANMAAHLAVLRRPCWIVEVT